MSIRNMFSWRNKKNIMWIPPLIRKYEGRGNRYQRLASWSNNPWTESPAVTSTITPDTTFFVCFSFLFFFNVVKLSFFSMKIYVVDTHWKCRAVAIPMSTPQGFHEENKKNINLYAHLI